MNIMTLKPKRFYGIFGLLVLALSVMGCNNSRSSSQNGDADQAQQVYVEAMKIHDDIMPQMNGAKVLKQQLNDVRDSIAADVVGDHKDQMAQIDSTINHLGRANREMMTWMKNVKTVPNMQGDKSAYSGEMTKNVVADTTNLLQIQREQKQKIQDVKDRMDKSMEDARNILNLPKINS